MPGHFVHVTLVDSLCKEPIDFTASPTILSALKNYTAYCKLGAISPDCPQCVGQDAASGWSKVMHHAKPSDFIRYVIPYIHGLSFNLSETRACIAWIFGYTAHLIADYTVHPVVKSLVGDYEKNPKGHRLCEFDQDVYIIKNKLGQEIVGSDCHVLCGMKECQQGQSKNSNLREIIKLWGSCLLQYPRSETKPYVRLLSRSIAPNVWIATYLVMIRMAAKGKAIVRLLGLSYPKSDAIKNIHIQNLPTSIPGKLIHYDELFDMTRKNIKASWTELALAIDTGDPTLFTLANADLDTGIDLKTGRSVYWA